MKGESPTLNSRGYLSRKFEDTFTTHEAFHKYLKSYWILNAAKFLGYCQYLFWLNNVNLGEGNFTPLLSTGVCATAWKISIKTSLNAASSRTFVTIALKLIWFFTISLERQDVNRACLLSVLCTFYLRPVSRGIILESLSLFLPLYLKGNIHEKSSKSWKY